MMGGFHFKAHVLQVQHNIPAHILRQVQGAHVKKSRHLVGIRGGPSVLIGVKQKELTFRACLEGISHVQGLPGDPAHHISGVPFKRLPAGPVHVADEPCHLPLLGPPGKDLKGIQIRVQVHIRLLNPHKPLNGRTVEHTAVVQSLPQLTGSNGNIL